MITSSAVTLAADWKGWRLRIEVDEFAHVKMSFRSSDDVKSSLLGTRIDPSCVTNVSTTVCAY